MKSRMIRWVMGAAMLAAQAGALPMVAEFALAQSPAPSPLPLPAPVEKELAAKAANVTEVTLDKNMLGFAAKFMDNKDKDQAQTSRLIQGLDGIYVRDYEFDKEGEYSMDEIEKLRQAIETPEWTPMVRDRERKGAEMTDVMVKMVNGETKGMFILSAEPKELSIVLILGTIRMDQLGMLKGIGGLSALAGVGADIGAQDKATMKAQEKAKEAQDRAEEKAKEAQQKAQDAGKDGTQ
jgi:Domain of unknown function (DUF4252)